MAFSEYGSYDGIGLAELVRNKQVSARELLDEAIARTAKVDPQINAVVVKHYDYAERQIERIAAFRSSARAPPEFGLMPTTESRLFGPTRNPWNLEHSSG